MAEYTVKTDHSGNITSITETSVSYGSVYDPEADENEKRRQLEERKSKYAIDKEKFLNENKSKIRVPFWLNVSLTIALFFLFAALTDGDLEDPSFKIKGSIIIAAMIYFILMCVFYITNSIMGRDGNHNDFDKYTPPNMERWKKFLWASSIVFCIFLLFAVLELGIGFMPF